MALTRDFTDAVAQGNLLRVRIMLKDSLLVDTSFKQFKEMLDYAEPELRDLWVSDEDDDEIFSQSPDALNGILVGLVNSFSRRRVKYLTEMIRKIYPPKSIPTNGGEKKAIKMTGEVVKEFNGIIENRRKMSDTCSKIKLKNQMDTSDIETIKKAAMNIIRHCDKISGKRV